MGLDGDSPWWHYSANKDDGSNQTCSERDLTCYFLPYHNCGSLSDIRNNYAIDIVENEEVVLPAECDIFDERGRNAYLFMTRKQLWLRRAVFDFKQRFKAKLSPESDCTVVHARRADVILHDGDLARRYFPIADYIKLIPKEKLDDTMHTIFLLTDDQNAIDEAHEFFPDLRFKYFNRTRHRGSEGGWENQTPSRNPELETVTLLATFDLASECSAMVHGHSNFAKYITEQMKLTRRDVNIFRVDADTDVFDGSYNNSEIDLENQLDDWRRKGVNLTSLLESETKTRTSESPVVASRAASHVEIHYELVKLLSNHD